MTTLTFQNTTLSVQTRNNQTFLTASDLGTALQYSHPIQNITKIFERNADEFTAEMTALVEMPTAGGKQQVRIFSLRGAHLIAMFARTKVAKDFRKWVLDILDREVQSQPQQIALPVEKTFPHEFKNHEAVDMAWLWYEAHRMADFIKTITPALEAIHSGFAAEAHSMGVEYCNHIQHIGKLIYRLTAEADFGYNPKPLDTLKKAIPARKQYGSCDF